MADGVADVMRERADGEGEFVGGLSVAQEVDHKVSGANVMGEVGEEAVAEWVVAEVLDGTAAVGVGVSFPELGLGECGVPFEENGLDGLLPGDVDQLLVSLDRVGDSWNRREEQTQDGYWSESGYTAGCRNHMPHFG